MYLNYRVFLNKVILVLVIMVLGNTTQKILVSSVLFWQLITGFSTQNLRAESNFNATKENNLEYKIEHKYKTLVDEKNEPKITIEAKLNEIKDPNLIKLVRDSKDYMPLISDLEKTLHIPDYRYIIGTESRFKPNAESHTGASCLAQLTGDGINGVYGFLKGIPNPDHEDHSIIPDSDYISKYFDKELVDSYDIGNLNPFKDELPLEKLGYKGLKYPDKSFKEKYERKITKIVLPRYLLSRKIFPELDFDKKKAREDPEINLKVGALLYFSNKLELSAYSPKRNVLELQPKLAPASYNRGISEVKRCLKENFSQTIQNPYSMLTKEKAEEAKGHYKRYIEYKNYFAELRRLNIEM